LSWSTSTRQHRLGERQTDLQARLVDVESAREKDRLRTTRAAALVASVVRQTEHWTAVHVRPARVDYFLRIANEGQAEARNIVVRFDGRPPAEHPLTVKGEPEVTRLGPGADARYFLAVTTNSPRLLEVELAWEDDSGEPGRWASEVKL